MSGGFCHREGAQRPWRSPSRGFDSAVGWGGTCRRLGAPSGRVTHHAPGSIPDRELLGIFLVAVPVEGIQHVHQVGQVRGHFGELDPGADMDPAAQVDGRYAGKGWGPGAVGR